VLLVPHLSRQIGFGQKLPWRKLGGDEPISQYVIDALYLSKLVLGFGYRRDRRPPSLLW
jgi:hypothetical protein